jgi:antibiotic biosynthesis monooxygenase (ABM) superfamily enzyme
VGREAEIGAMADTLDLRTALPEEIASHHQPRADMVTSIIEHEVKAGRETEYETWLKKIAPIAARFPGHQGVSFVRPSPGSNKYTVLLKFDTLKQAQTWIHSAAREALVAEVKPYLVKDENIDVQTGLEFWFRPPSGKGFPSRLKQSAVTLLVLYPLTLIVPRLWGLGSQIAPPLGNVFVLNLVVDATIVGLLTYVFMPRATRLFSRWLYA